MAVKGMDSVRRVAPGGPTGFSRDLAAACRVEDRVCLYFFCGPSRSIIEPIQSLLRMLDRKEPQVTAHKHKTGVRPHKLVEQYQGRRSPVCPDGDLQRPHHDIQRHRQEAQSPAPYEARRCLGADPETVRRRLVKYGARIHDRHGQGTSTRFDGCVSLVDGDAKTNNRTTRRSRPQRNSSARRVRPACLATVSPDGAVDCPRPTLHPSPSQGHRVRAGESGWRTSDFVTNPNI